MRRFPKATLAHGLWLPVIRAALKIQHGKPLAALPLLEHTRTYEAAARFWPAHLRGQSYLELHRASEAAVEFQHILDHRGEDPFSPIYPLAHLGLGRAAAMTGNKAGSRRAYQEFFALWKDADRDVPVLLSAKKEYAILFDEKRRMQLHFPTRVVSPVEPRLEDELRATFRDCS